MTGPKEPAGSRKTAARFAYDGLDRVIHEKARLGVLTALVTHPDGVAFADLKSLCALTDGNLSRHLQILRQDGLVEIEKSFVNNRPHTACRITTLGQSRYLEYIEVLETLLKDAASAAKGAAAPSTA